MTDAISEIIDRVIAAEGGYSNNPNDRGGETMYGITKAVALANGYEGPMRDMPIAFARAVYRQSYVTEPGFDKVALLSKPIAAELVDTGVNMGPRKAAEFLQKWLNGFSATPVDLVVDGKAGAATRDALKSFLDRRGKEGEEILVRCLNASQAMRYLEITEANKPQRTFLYGWVKERVKM